MLEWVLFVVKHVTEVVLIFWHPQTRIKLENISFISYLVFHHSLRIRLKDDILDEKKKDEKEISAEASAEASSPSSSATGISAHADETESVSDETLVVAEPESEGGHVKERTGAIVGRINNLVTSDLSSVEDSFRAVEIREHEFAQTMFIKLTALLVISLYCTSDNHLRFHTVQTTELEVSQRVSQSYVTSEI